MATTLGLNKGFILDKYFAELNKYWQNECLHQQEKPKINYNNQKLSNDKRLINNNNNNNNNNNKHHQQLQQFSINDLIHLEAPITEELLIKSLHTRYLSNEYFTNIGPVLISLNTFNDVNNSLTLDSVNNQNNNNDNENNYYSLNRIVYESVKQQNETGYPQVIILSGMNGSGKTYSSMIILRQLFNIIGGGTETDSYKHLSASFTVLRSLTTSSTKNNNESSRIGTFIELQISNDDMAAIYRTKIHCYFIDQSRIINRNNRNYHIFYQMFYGLTLNEKQKLYLNNYQQLQQFNYLNFNINNEEQIIENYINRFNAWKSCLSILGISFINVARILSSILLIGNINYNQNNQNENVIYSVASLLGITTIQLLNALKNKTISNDERILIENENNFNRKRDSLAKALYLRTVLLIIKHANSSKRLIRAQATRSISTSSESNDSSSNNLNRIEINSNHQSSIGSACGKSYKSMAVLQNAVNYSTTINGFIGILDMFGFENDYPNRLEQLCINLCAETMQHFYNTHIFKSSIESCRDESIESAIQIDYVDNVPCIDLISSLRTGLFSLLDYETLNNGTSETLIDRQSSIHSMNNRYITIENNLNEFGIRHFFDNVIYNTEDFIDINRDELPIELILLFHKSTCTFDFVTQLFNNEYRLLKNNNRHNKNPLEQLKFHTTPIESSSSSVTFTQNFHNRLDNLLRILVHARPHFIRCIKINTNEQPNYFDRTIIIKQIRSLQILETINLMAEGLPHRMRFKAFINRYQILIKFKNLINNNNNNDNDTLIDDCRKILTYFNQLINQSTSSSNNYSTAALTLWTIGRKHIFLSESARQQLEIVRNNRRNSAATLIQSLWRGYYLRKIQLPFILNQKNFNNQHQQQQKPKRPQPISFDNTIQDSFNNNNVKTTNDNFNYDFNLIKETCQLLGIDPNIPPKLPPNRLYTIINNNQKLYFPQIRTLRMDFIDPMNHLKIYKGQNVIVLGFSLYKRGYFTVEYSKGLRFDLPQHLVELN